MIGALLLNLIFASNSVAKVSDCVLSASKQQVLSLGKPVASERLSGKEHVRVAILPFYFTDGAAKQLSAVQKSNYLAAAKLITDLSNQNVKIEVTFLKSFNTNKPASSLKQAYLDRKLAYNGDSTKGTWGFVRDTILAADSSTDFTNFDSVILEGNNADRSYYIGEAMSFFRGTTGNVFEGAASNFYRSIETDEGFIDNAILLDGPKTVGVIAHELMHNFGLTDLYGGEAPQAGVLSMMVNSETPNLLSYEKAVLGWLPENQIQCLSISDLTGSSILDSKVTFNDINIDQVFILDNGGRYFILEIVNYLSRPLLVIYEIRIDARPPLTFLSRQNGGMWFENVTAFSPIDLGKEFQFSNLTVIYSDIDRNKVSFNIIQESQKDTDEYRTLRIAIQNKKSELIALELESSQKAKKTVICVKGNIKKKITDIKPKCPKGYKRK